MTLRFSYSFLSQDDNCPEAARQIYVLRAFKKSYAAVEGGVDDHKELEQRLRYKKPLPEALKKAEPLAASLEKHGDPKVEVSLSVNRDLQPATYETTWIYGKYDVTVRLSPERGFIGDWKSGKIRESSDQLEIGALLWFANDPDLYEITTANLWLQTNVLGAMPRLGTPYVFKRPESGERWAKWIARMTTIEKRDPAKEWEKRPSALCPWCPVATCQYFAGGKGR